MDQKEAIQKKIKENIKEYFLRLTQGCRRTNCKEPYCISNPDCQYKPKDPNEAASISFQLSINNVKSDITFCDFVPHFSKSSIEKDIEQAKSTNNFVPLIRTYGNLFANSDTLNISFLKNGPDTPATPDESGIDFQQMHDAYQLIVKEENLSDIILSSFDRLIKNIQWDIKTFKTPKSARQFLLILMHPLLPSKYNILVSLYERILDLREEVIEYIVNWISKFDFETRKNLLAINQNLINNKIDANTNEKYHSDKSIIISVRFTQIFYDANKKTNDTKLSINDFYNFKLSKKIDSREDFIRWMKKDTFSFCKYPYILDPAVKAKLLTYESRVSQNVQRRQALSMLIGGHISSPFLVFEIRRENLIQDCLECIERFEEEDFKKELKVKFIGEEGIDEGGVKKEFFQLVVKEIFDPKFGMFTLVEEASQYWINNTSIDFREFELIGIILGLAIYNRVILDIQFPNVIYKKLMGLPTNLKDLFDINAGLAKGLEQLLEFKENVEDVFCRDFTVEYDYFGEKRIHELKPGGADISLTNENRQEYVDLYVDYLLNKSIEKQFESFKKGFTTVVSGGVFFEFFVLEEVELLVCGSKELDFKELENRTAYESGYTKDHIVVKWFWEVVHSLSEEQKKKFLFFSTGSDRAPIGGLKNLKFIIAKHGDGDERLPQTHTCFNHFLLPEYSSKECLEQKLLKAISNSVGFGMR